MDDIHWNELHDAYGSAEDVPQLLEMLTKDTKPKNDYKEEPWFSLWSKLCHQGDVYTASYAALPTIVKIAASAEDPISPDFFLLPACIEIARVKGNGPTIPNELSENYHSAVSDLARVAESHSQQAEGDLQTAIRVASLVGAGKINEADDILNSD